MAGSILRLTIFVVFASTISCTLIKPISFIQNPFRLFTDLRKTFKEDILPILPYSPFNYAFNAYSIKPISSDIEADIDERERKRQYYFNLENRVENNVKNIVKISSNIDVKSQNITRFKNKNAFVVNNTSSKLKNKMALDDRKINKRGSRISSIKCCKNEVNTRHKSSPKIEIKQPRIEIKQSQAELNSTKRHILVLKKFNFGGKLPTKLPKLEKDNRKNYENNNKFYEDYGIHLKSGNKVYDFAFKSGKSNKNRANSSNKISRKLNDLSYLNSNKLRNKNWMKNDTNSLYKDLKYIPTNGDLNAPILYRYIPLNQHQMVNSSSLNVINQNSYLRITRKSKKNPVFENILQSSRKVLQHFHKINKSIDRKNQVSHLKPSSQYNEEKTSQYNNENLNVFINTKRTLANEKMNIVSDKNNPNKKIKFFNKAGSLNVKRNILKGFKWNGRFITKLIGILPEFNNNFDLSKQLNISYKKPESNSTVNGITSDISNTWVPKVNKSQLNSNYTRNWIFRHFLPSYITKILHKNRNNTLYNYIYETYYNLKEGKHSNSDIKYIEYPAANAFNKSHSSQTYENLYKTNVNSKLDFDLMNPHKEAIVSQIYKDVNNKSESKLANDVPEIESEVEHSDMNLENSIKYQRIKRKGYKNELKTENPEKVIKKLENEQADRKLESKLKIQQFDEEDEIPKTSFFSYVLDTLSQLPVIGNILRASVDPLYRPIVKKLQPESEALMRGEANLKNWCFGELGCIKPSIEFYHPLYRPVNLPPYPREKIATSFTFYSRIDTDGILVPSKQLDIIVYNSSFSTTRKTKFIVHGFVNYRGETWIREMVRGLLQHGNYNVIVVDWSGGSYSLYSQATANIRVVALEISRLIIWLQKEFGLDASDVHIIGHSLGSHTAGYVGERIKGLGRITGLDPAEPFFQYMPRTVRLDPGDAKFVDVIHTDINPFFALTGPRGFGLRQPVGHVDFYPNGGREQPGCNQLLSRVPVTFMTEGKDVIEGINAANTELFNCDHVRSTKLFTDSLTSDCPYMGFACQSYSRYKEGKCFDCGSHGELCAFMGINSDQWRPTNKSNAIFFLDTYVAPNFCKYHYILKVKFRDVIKGKSSKIFNGTLRGRLKITLIDRNGNLKKFDLNSLSPTKFPKYGSKSYLLEHTEDLSDTKEALVDWVFESDLLDPLSYCVLFCKADMKISSVTLIGLDTWAAARSFRPSSTEAARDDVMKTRVVMCHKNGEKYVTIPTESTVKISASNFCQS